MPFDMATLNDFVPMDHRAVQPIGATVLKVFDAAGTEIPGYHHIIRGDTGSTIRVAPESYPIVQNEFAVDTIETALQKSRLDLTDARFGVDYSHDGARMFAQWLLPAHTALVRPGVEATLRVVLLNSYDGSTALHARVGAYNWVCANTSVSGKEFASFRFRHQGEVDIVPAVAKLTLAAEDHVEQVRRWELWPAIPMSDQTMRAVISSLPKASDAQVDALIHAYLKARDEDPLQGGPNLWCLYNVLTAWASKGEGRTTVNRAALRWEREKLVAEVVEGRLWAEITSASPKRAVVLPAAQVEVAAA